MIKDIQGKSSTSDEFHVIDLDGPTRLIFQKQIEDIIISSPDGDIFIGWDYDKPEDFTPDNCMLLQAADKMKEISKERCTHFYMMPKEQGKTIKVYVTVQK